MLSEQISEAYFNRINKRRAEEEATLVILSPKEQIAYLCNALKCENAERAAYWAKYNAARATEIKESIARIADQRTTLKSVL